MPEKQKHVISFEIEQSLANSGYRMICGVDEAGRGPLAGPVYAAAVILNEQFEPHGLNDSKKLTERKREELYDYIIDNSLAYSIAYADVDEIEEINILQASMLAMRRAVDGLDMPPDYVLVDGNRLPDLQQKATAIVSGDARSYSIAAASILAKVSRDRYMFTLDELYPQYGFKKHKGYGTKVHTNAILEHGSCPHHRLSFLKKLLNRE